MSESGKYGSYTKRILKVRAEGEKAAMAFYGALESAERDGRIDQERANLKALYDKALRLAQKYKDLSEEAERQGQIRSPLDAQDAIGNADFSVRIIKRRGREYGF